MVVPPLPPSGARDKGDKMADNALRLVEKENMDRGKALDQALTQIERAFGKGSIMRLGQRAPAVEADVVSTGSIGLDIALGIGGLPRGRIVEIYGPESSGKTTLALHVIAESQKNGGTAAFIDAEHALDPIYAKKLGVNLDELLISQPDAGEQALEIADTLVRSGAIDVLVVDSVAALVPRAELEGEMGDTHVGLQARLMSQALRKLTSSISRSKPFMALAVSASTGLVNPRWRSVLVAVMPSITGIWMSMRIRSGSCSAARSRPIAPFSASTMSRPASPSTTRSSSRFSRPSSTTRILRRGKTQVTFSPAAAAPCSRRASSSSTGSQVTPWSEPASMLTWKMLPLPGSLVA